MSIKNTLSKSEYEVAFMVSKGFIEKEIAAVRFVSLHTVRAQTATIRKKLKARNAVDVAREFILSHENPKQLFIAIGFILIQGFMMVTYTGIDMRRPTVRGRARKELKIN